MEITDHEFGDPNEPVYLLSLDGGGIRGISEAVILHEIMTRIQKELGLPDLPKPCDYFHLIGGTSTGGLIAIMLGRLRMTTQEVIDEYEAISHVVFNKKNKRFDKSFKPATLEQAIRSVAKPRVGEYAPLATKEDDVQKGLSFVVSLKKGGDDNTPTVFRSYKSQGEETTCRLWEAARATTAAPGVFPPARIVTDDGPTYFIDGAVKWNNPSWIVLQEAEARFGSHSRRLGCLVSLGTGLRPPSLDQEDKNEKKWFKPTYSVSELARMTLNYLTDPEPTHRELEAWLKPQPDSYFRFSVPYNPGEDRIRIFDYHKMDALRLSTEKYIKTKEVSDRLDEIVDVLCSKRSTDISLHAACHASSAETTLADMEHMLRKQDVTSAIFTGRDDILDKLDHVFSRREPASSPRRDFWLWGVGGVGKTQIALRFIDHFADRFDKVLWLNASDVSMIHHSFKLIATQVLQHPGEAPHILPVLNWLNNTKEEWLLVIDNYDSGDITRYLPSYRKGNILYTSRRYNLPPEVPRESMLHVFEMGMTDSTRLLIRASRRDENDEKLWLQASPVVEKLGALPLGLITAGALISMRGWTFDQYLTNLCEETSQVLSWAPPGSDASESPSIYANFELSFKSVKSYARGSPEQGRFCQSALQILNTFCFYHSENVPVEMILRAGLGIKLSGRWHDIGLTEDINPEPGAGVVLGIRGGMPIDYDYIIGGLMVLVQFSLLRQPSKEAAYSIHPLVHSWLRDRMRPGTFDHNLKTARSILYHSFHQHIRDADAERFYPSLLPHMKANNSYQFKSNNEIPFITGLVINWKYLQILKRSHLWEEAMPLLEKDISSLIFELDHNNWRTLNAMIELGKAYMAMGRIIDAEDVFQQVLDRTRYCPSQAWARKCYVHVCSELSMVYLVQGNFGSAQLMAETGFRYGETRGVNAVMAMARLSLVYQYLERWSDALPLADAVLRARVRTRQKGPEHHATLKAKAEVAYIRARLGYIDAAEAVLADVAKRFKAELGRDHHDTLVARTNLAWVHFAQFRLGEAEVAQREILAAGRAVLGERHLYTLYMMLRLGLTLGESGKFAEAIELLDECVEGRIAVLWEIHPAVGGAHVWRSVFMSRMEGYDYAADISEADIKALEKGKRLAENPYTPVQI